MRLLMLAAVAMTVLAGIGYLYYVDSQNKLADLHTQLGAQKVQTEALQQSVGALRSDAETLKKNTEAFNGALNVIREDTQRHEAILQKHDLGKIGGAHPAMLEKRINDGSKRLFDHLEKLSQ